jgi:putative tryptophan/tyrosine transport system substrate-binding protein
MTRREFICVLSAVTLPPLAARATQPGKVRRLAFVHSGLPTDELTESAGPFWVQQFYASMRRLGHVEGSNLIVERSSAEGQNVRFAALARAVVARQPDVIVSNGNLLVAALKQATATIPIVGIVADPLRTGLVESLAHPARNVTGVSIDAGLEIYGKRLQIFKELVPSATRIAYLASRTEWDSLLGRQLREVGDHFGLDVVGMLPQPITAETLRRAFTEGRSAGLSGVLVSGSGDFLAHRALLVELAASAQLPALYPYRDYVELGGLAAYAPDLAETAGRLADQVHQILGGRAPGEIPFEQATRFELVLNLKSARALGIVVPSTMIVQANEVIE